jgi:hypothetical protein
VHQTGFSDIKSTLFTHHSELKSINFDFDLEFLDGYVQEAINQGASEFDEEKKELAISITGTHDTVNEKELNFTPYEKPTRGAVQIKSQPRVTSQPNDPGEVKLVVKNTSKKGRWTKSGYVGNENEMKIETKPTTVQQTAEEEKKEETPKLKKGEKKQPEQKPKKNKLAGALFAGVVKKGKDSAESDSDKDDSDEDEEDSDEDEKPKKKSKDKGKEKAHDVEQLMSIEQPQTKTNMDELFDLGDSQDVDPYKMMSESNQAQSVGSNLLETSSPQLNMMGQPNLGGLPFGQMPNINQNYGYPNQQNFQPGGGMPQSQQQQPESDDPFADLVGAFSNQPNSGKKQ